MCCPVNVLGCSFWEAKGIKDVVNRLYKWWKELPRIEETRDMEIPEILKKYSSLVPPIILYFLCLSKPKNQA